MAVFFTSDTHFSHAGALGFYHRPFKSVAEMDTAMLDRWNKLVGPDDDIWHLGDFALGVSEPAIAELLGRLHGRKHLITGNNDAPAMARLTEWTSVQPYVEIELDGVGLVLCHYPFRSWRNMSRGWRNLHGHSHGRLAPLPRQADVGVDAWDFRPVTLAQIMAAKPSRTGTARSR
jgi:calcineurin-like phosphoesterase family protein